MFMKTFSIIVITTLRHNNAYNVGNWFRIFCVHIFEYFPMRIICYIHSTDCLIIYLVTTLWLDHSQIYFMLLLFNKTRRGYMTINKRQM